MKTHATEGSHCLLLVDLPSKSHTTPTSHWVPAQIATAACPLGYPPPTGRALLLTCALRIQANLRPKASFLYHTGEYSFEFEFAYKALLLHPRWCSPTSRL